MEVSSSTNVNTDINSAQMSPLKKSLDVAEQSAMKIIESATEQSKEITAQKTGMGNNLNIMG
jgi:CTP-dependent riboflavin kinase